MRHGVQYVIMLGMILLPLLFVSNKDFLLMVCIYMIISHFLLILMVISKVLLLLKMDIAPLSCQQILSLSPVVVMKTQ